MSSSDDNPHHPKSLPPQELNPLTNPVLGRNMGRWAEVYFTNPPEKREQAVQELLRVLEGEAPEAKSAAPAMVPPPHWQPFAEPSRTAAGTMLREEPVREELPQCEACGSVARAEQKFCGACGTPLPTPAATSAPEPAAVSERTVETPEPAFCSGPGNFENAQKAESAYAPSFSLSQPDEQARRSHKLMAVALAIVVVTLFFVAARETAAWLRAAHHAQQDAMAASPAANHPSPAMPAQSEQGVAADQPVSSVPGESLPSPKRDQSRQEQPNRAEAVNSTVESSRQTVPPPAGASGEKSTSSAPSTTSGAEELSIAESYLSGTQGKARDSSQAAQWLWKSVAKQNAAAAVLLSDLYVTGDGVPRSCDQARILLDTAARRGTSGAAERIRNLPNLGCR